ncbi:MAG: cytochrome c biogenesis protein ResB [Dissulfuribacterales bacterium]
MTKQSDSDGLADTFWKFFTSVKLSVFILLSLAVTSIIGTVIPQNENPILYLRKYGEFRFSLFNALDLFDMYHSLWFRFLLCMLTVNIVVCSINRLSVTWKIIFPKTPKFTINRFRKIKNRQEWTSNSTPETLKTAYAPYLEKRFKTFLVEPAENGYHLFAEKGRWTRLGVYVVHLSIMFMVIGGLIGSIFGFDGYVNIPEKESVSSIFLQNSEAKKELGFEIRCNDFNISFYDSGMPKEYRSSLSIIKNNKEVIKKEIIVNDPLRYSGINIFQSSYGQTPGNKLKVTFTERASDLKYEKQAVMGEPVKMPGNKGILRIEDFKNHFSYKGISIDNVYLCRIIPDTGKPEHIMIPVNSRFDAMRNGEFIIAIANADFKYYTGLQVTKDPGVPIVYMGFIFMIIGCYITFFMFHKKICVELTTAEGKTNVMVSGISGKNGPGMLSVTKRLANHLKRIN